MSLPAQFGSYTLERNLGKGGSSEVWLARHSHLKDHCVAIKVLMSQDAETVRRFQREAAIAARLRHPNIVQLHDFGYNQPFYYAILEYVEGASLREILTRRERLPLAEALALLAQIATALDYAHSLSIVHRDITPANILVAEPTRRALLTDFGIARGPGAPITELNAVMGTKGYLSPEALQSALHATHRSDIFSLGVVLYQALSGQLPWEIPPRDGDPAAFAERKTLLDRSVTGLPPEIDRVLATMLAVEPAQRYPTAGAAIDDLRRMLARHENTTQILSPRRTSVNAIQPIALQASGVTPNEVEQLLSPDLAGPVIARAHRRADELQNPETLTTLLNAWAAASPFRRPLLGRLARLHKITSHNVYFYRLQVLYEQRGSPEISEEPDRTAEVFELEPELEPWAVPLPPPQQFVNDPGGRVRLPGSTRVAACQACQGRGATPCPTCRGRQRVIEHRPVPPPPAQATAAPTPTTARRSTPTGSLSPEVAPDQPKTQPVLVPCGTCAGRGGVSCERCDGIGRLVQRKTISWSRQPQRFTAQDDLPALDEDWLARTCKAERVYHEQHHGGLRPEWAMVGTLSELTRTAEAAQGERRIVLSELTIDLIPVTEIIFDLGKTGEDDLYKVAIFGFENLIPPDWRFFNWERVGAMVAVGFMAVLVLVLLAFQFLG
ncbi:MAG: protein kinase domain-containing protein [Oscillochloridaceae bacterium umkhey_bin13]